jgi:hypothetical protein
MTPAQCLEYHQPGARRILEMPVYRCTDEQHYNEQEEKCKEAVSSVKQSLRMLGKDPDTAPETKNYKKYVPQAIRFGSRKVLRNASVCAPI